MEKVRPQVEGSEDAAQFFTTFSGNGMTSSQVTKCIKSIFKKAQSSFLPSATIMRKSAVTNARENARHLSGDLADLMLHREKTADQYYKLTEKSKIAISASKELGQLMRCVDEDEKEESLEGELPREKETMCQRVDRMLETKSSQKFADINSDIVAPSESYKTSALFDQDDSELLARLFEGMIDNVPISMVRIQKTLEEDGQGEKLLGRFTINQVHNRIKYMRRMRRQAAETKAMKAKNQKN